MNKSIYVNIIFSKAEFSQRSAVKGKQKEACYVPKDPIPFKLFYHYHERSSTTRDHPSTLSPSHQQQPHPHLHTYNSPNSGDKQENEVPEMVAQAQKIRESLSSPNARLSLPLPRHKQVF